MARRPASVRLSPRVERHQAQSTSAAPPTLTTGQMVPLQTDINGKLLVSGAAGGTASSFSTAFPASGTAAGAEYLTSPPTLTTGQMVPLQTDVNGKLLVSGVASSFGTTFPSSGTAAGAEYLVSPPTFTTGQMVPLQTDINGQMKVTAPTTGLPGFNAPDLTSTSGNLNVQDAGVTCANTPAPIQSQCTGTPTTGSTYSVTVSAATNIGVVATLTGGTATVSVSSEASWDGGATWYARGIFLDSNAAPIWKNGIGNATFSGTFVAGSGITNYRLRLTTFTVLTSSPVVTFRLNQTQSNAFVYVGNLPTASAGTSSVAAVNVQGETGGIPLITNQTQQAGTTLCTPSAVGTPCVGNVPTVNAAITSGTVTASLGGFTPSASGARMTPLTVTTSDSSGSLPTGTVVVVTDAGATNGMYCNVNGVAATASDQAISPGGGWFSFTIPAGITTLHCIGNGGSTTANGLGGSGLATGTGGGGGGSGGGSANVFQATLFSEGSSTSAATTQVIAASGSTVIYLVNYPPNRCGCDGKRDVPDRHRNRQQLRGRQPAPDACLELLR